MRRFYVTAILVIEAENPQAAVDELLRTYPVDTEGDPFTEIVEHVGEDEVGPLMREVPLGEVNIVAATLKAGKSPGRGWSP